MDASEKRAGEAPRGSSDSGANHLVLPERAKRDVLRVAHFGTGAMGRHVLRMLLQRPGLDLVAHLVHTPSKVGRDSAEIVGMPPVGVRATADLNEFLAVEADCVTYCPKESDRPIGDMIDEISRTLAAGKNVVASPVQLLYPPVLPTALLSKLSEACEAGGTSFFGTGVGPGFTPDVLVITCSSVCHRVRYVEVSTRILGRAYPYIGQFVPMGFGLTPRDHEQRYRPGAFLSHFGGVVAMIADALCIELDDIRESQDVAVAPNEVAVAGGRIQKGQIASVRFRIEGIVHGEPRIVLNRVSCQTDEPIEDWEPQIPAGSAVRRLTRVAIDGDPSVRCDFGLVGGLTPGEEATAGRVVNAIRTVCGAPPGVHTPLSLPCFGGEGAGKASIT